jgi:hypothetical protein
MATSIAFIPFPSRFIVNSPHSANDVIIVAHYGYSCVAYIQGQYVGKPGLRIAVIIYLDISENNA